ncbi:hypothetical protein ACFL9U_06165 [Thermodesulfobacteriota bacterium]
MHIYLLGVSHDQQTDPSPEFVAYIKATCRRHGIRSFAEELSLDGLSDVGASESILKRIADGMDVPHKYCGPTRRERAQRGILGSQDIQIQAFQDDWPPSRIDEEEKRYFGKIEYAWLEKLRPVFVDPMLFVCGAAHLDSFPQKAKEGGFTAIVLEPTFITSGDDFIRKRTKK